MAELTVHVRQEDPAFQAAAAGGDTFRNDGSTEMLIMNTGIAPVVVTAIPRRACSHGFLDAWQKTVEAGSLLRFGPFSVNRFNDSSGLVTVIYAASSDLQVSAQRQK